MQVERFAEIQAEFLERINKAVYCNKASFDRKIISHMILEQITQTRWRSVWSGSYQVFAAQI